jgi:hypothetical protein
MKRPLYCKCGGLIKTKGKEVHVHRPMKLGKYYLKNIYAMNRIKSITTYACSKCGKKY